MIEDDIVMTTAELLQRALVTCAIDAGADLSAYARKEYCRTVDDYGWRHVPATKCVNAVRALRADYDNACNEVWELSEELSEEL